MDQAKVGRFLAQLRRGENLTQEALAERIGVTNKTISRWENGNYMPDIEMLQMLGRIFDVSIEELLDGQRAQNKPLEKQAEESCKQPFFSVKEESDYWKGKWRREHRTLLSCLAGMVAAMLVLPMLFHRPWLGGLAMPMAAVAYGYQNNRMMIYVEKKLYHPTDAHTKATHE